jgi:hypothetical protein
MWKLFTIAALAASIMSGPALAARAHVYSQAPAQQSYQGGAVPSSNAYGPNY